MRTRWLALTSFGVVLLQLSWPAHSGMLWVVPNFFLVFLVLASTSIDTTRLLWMALGGGLLLDISSVQQFGLNMAFYILAVLVLKVVWQMDQRNVVLATLVLAALLLSMCYALVAHLAFLSATYIPQWGPMLARITVESILNCCTVAAIVTVMHLRQRGIISS